MKKYVVAVGYGENEQNVGEYEIFATVKAETAKSAARQVYDDITFCNDEEITFLRVTEKDSSVKPEYFRAAIFKPEETKMKFMVNSADSRERFYDDELEKAKAYYIPTNEMLKEYKNKEDYLGDNYEDYCRTYDEYVQELKESKSIEELVSVLNQYTYILGDCTEFKVKEV